MDLVSIIIPVFDEYRTIQGVLERIKQLPLHKEVIVVDDGSADKTRNVLVGLEAEGEITLVSHAKNRGKGAAIRAGIAQAHGDVIVLQDADLEYDPADIPSLVAPIGRGESEAVFGSRYLSTGNQQQSMCHRCANWVLTAIANAVNGTSLSDMETGYKAFRSHVLAEIKLREDGFGIEPEIAAKLAKQGVRIHEVPISYHPRSKSEGKKIRLVDGIWALWCIMRYRVRD